MEVGGLIVRPHTNWREEQVRGHWPPKGWIVRSHTNWRGERVLTKTLAPKGVDCEIPHRFERGTSVNEDAGPRRGWIVRSQIGWRGERSILYKGVKTLRGSSEGKAQRKQYLLGLGRYRLFVKVYAVIVCLKILSCCTVWIIRICTSLLSLISKMNSISHKFETVDSYKLYGADKTP